MIAWGIKNLFFKAKQVGKAMEQEKAVWIIKFNEPFEWVQV